MKSINIGCGALISVLQYACGITSKNSNMQFLSHVLLEVNENILSVFGNNGNVEIECICKSISSSSSFSILVSGHKILNTCRLLDENSELEIELSDKEDSIQISSTSDRYKCKISVSESHGYPKMSFSDKETTISISVLGEDLIRVFKKVLFAVGENHIRSCLNGVIMNISKEGKIYVIGSDAYRLAKTSIEGTYEIEREFQVIVPKKSIIELMKIVGKSESNIKMDISEKHVRFSIDNISLTSSIIDSRFPEYKIALEGCKVAVIDREPITKSLMRIMVLSDAITKSGRFVFNENKLEIFFRNDRRETIENSLDIEYSNEKVEIGLNVEFLIEYLSIIKAEKIEFHLKNEDREVLVTEKESDGYVYAVMPYRI